MTLASGNVSPPAALTQAPRALEPDGEGPPPSTPGLNERAASVAIDKHFTALDSPAATAAASVAAGAKFAAAAAEDIQNNEQQKSRPQPQKNESSEKEPPGIEPQKSEQERTAERHGAAAAAAVAEGAGVAASAAAAADDEQLRKKYEEEFVSILNEVIEHTSISTGTGGQPKTLGQPEVHARLVILSRKLAESGGTYASYRQAYFAAKLLRESLANVTAVNDIIDDIEFSSSKNSPIYSVMKGMSKSVFYLFSAGAVVLALFVIPYSLSPFTGGTMMETASKALFTYFFLWKSPLVISILFGILGSVVSILLRLSDFEGATRKSRQFLTLTGAMLPLVGGIFAAVTCALFASGIINFQFAGNSSAQQGIENPYFYVVIGFLSGFSERFTRGLLGTAESAVTGGKGDNASGKTISQ